MEGSENIHSHNYYADHDILQYSISPLLTPPSTRSSPTRFDEQDLDVDVDYLPPSPHDSFPTQSPLVKCVRDKYLSRLGYRPLRFATGTLPHHQSPGAVRRLPSAEQFQKKSVISHALRAGGTISSIFNLCSATLGAGSLSLPYVFAKSGIFLAFCMLIFGAVATIFSIKLLIWCRTRARLATYEDLAVKCFSNRGALFVELSIILFCFGTCIAYTVAIADVVHPIVSHYVFSQGSVFGNRNFLISFLVLTIILPLSMMESLGSLRFANMMGVFSVGYLVLSVTIHSIYHMSQSGVPQFELEDLFRASWEDFFMSLPIVMFAFTCQVNVFSIYTELHRPCIRRMNRVVVRAVSIICLLYACIGCFGYLENLDKTAPDILHNYRIIDPIMAAAQLCVGFTLIVAYPLNLFPCRKTLEMMFFADKPNSKMRHFLLTFSIIFGATLLAIIVPGINSVFVLIGAVCSSIICYILPGLFYLKVQQGTPFSKEKLGAICLILVGSVVGIISTIMSAVQMTQSGDDQ